LSAPKIFSVMFKFSTPKYNLGVAVLQCEVCGCQIVGKPFRVIIEGAKMTTCAECSELGSDYWKPESKSYRHPAETKTETAFRSIPVSRKKSVNVPEDSMAVEDFGLLVRQAREKLGLSHEELGRKIGEKVSVIRKIENEKMAPDQKLAAKLQHALRVKLFVPLVEPERTFPSSPPSKGVTLGEIAVLKNGKRRRLQKDEGDHS